MYTPKKTILTAGPSIGSKEISYVMDAVKNGWNDHWADYIHKFEDEFSKYIGVKYAIATSGGTGALHLALAALGVGPGCEVILPEITYFACSDVVMLLGAKPVFADILPDTWCIDPLSVEKLVTKKTKVIMTVNNYGNLVEIEKIQKIAKKHDIKILEDACPSIGSLNKGKHPGSYGDFAAFSFQGAKIMVTGFGGMLVTNNKKLYEKAMYLNNHGEDPKKKFWQTSVGYTYEMSNIQAALGLAQLSRIDEFVAKKRLIYNWYKERLGGIDGLILNTEKKETKCNMILSSVVLLKDFGIKRDSVIREMKKRLVDTRPFFYPISMFPLYKEANTPVAHKIALNGINLPSGLNLTEKEIDYVCRTLKDILGVK
jgi:perosamine synthetase